MNLSYEKSRDRYITAEEKTRNIFSLSQRDGICDAVYLDSEMKRTVAFLGLPYAAPICARFLSHQKACEFIEETAKDAYLFVFSSNGLVLRTKDGEEEIPENIYNAVVSSFSEIVCAKGELQDNRFENAARRHAFRHKSSSRLQNRIRRASSHDAESFSRFFRARRVPFCGKRKRHIFKVRSYTRGQRRARKQAILHI